MRNVSSVIKAELDYYKAVLDDESLEMHDELNEEMLKGLLFSLGHAKEVKIGRFCFEVDMILLTRVSLGRLLPYARGLRFESLRGGFPSRWGSVGFCPIDASIRGWQGLPSGAYRLGLSLLSMYCGIESLIIIRGWQGLPSGWYDPPMCQRSVQIIPRLLRSRNELEEILAMVEEKRGKLLTFLIISWVTLACLEAKGFTFPLNNDWSHNDSPESED
ncbi:hypothetical protein Tco_0116924 [Tanacetum coccineum]